MSDVRDRGATRYAALVSAGTTYGLARRRVVGPVVVYETLDRETGDWRPDQGGAAIWTGIGGVTDAEDVEPERAAEIERELRA